MTRAIRNKAIIWAYDLCTIPIAWLFAYWVRDNLSSISSHLFHDAVNLLPLVIIVQAVTFWMFGLYRGEWRFASIPDLIRILKSVIVAAVSVLTILYFTHNILHFAHTLPPRSIMPLYILTLMFLLGGARLLYRWRREYHGFHKSGQRTLIIGAGSAGEGLIRDLFRDVKKRYLPVGLIDDNPRKMGAEILGVRVLGQTTSLHEIAKRLKIDLVLIAMPSVDGKTMRGIVEECNKAKIEYRTLPGLSSLASGEVTVNDLRPVSLEDLLGREPIDLHEPRLTQAFHNKKVLVTGGGGSIGSELCRQLTEFELAELIIFEHSEYNLYAIEHELMQRHNDLNLTVYLQDVTEKHGVENLINQHKPDIIFHAAAYKHVPLLETQACVAAMNNVIGTKIVAEAAVANNVEEFVLISTDKAVNPSNVMGTTKRIAEIFCQNLNDQSNTRFITVRFGNVLGSAGSVVPLFQKQLEQGGPITVTHPDITRYFMTIPEASQLILHASSMGHGGEIYVFDMGEPIKITYLAEQMIKLSGKTLHEDIEIAYTGLRPGEKLYEELFHDSENLTKTKHEKLLQAASRKYNWDKLVEQINLIEQRCYDNKSSEVLVLLKELVPENQIQASSNV
tara:strand:- start:196053 stop:197909 length:1857 start_codon:yes stop_codon:yes gene_type:complete